MSIKIFSNFIGQTKQSNKDLLSFSLKIANSQARVRLCLTVVACWAALFCDQSSCFIDIELVVMCWAAYCSPIKLEKIFIDIELVVMCWAALFCVDQSS